MTDHEPGSIQPLRPDGTVDEAAVVTSPGTRRRGFVIGGAVVGVVAVLAVGAVVAWRVLVGSAFASADAVPADADFVVTFDLLQLRDSDQLNRLIEAFTQPAADLGYLEDGDVDVIEAIDEQLDEEVGFTLSDDVIPWIGRSVSFAVWFDRGATLEDLASGEDPPVSGVLVVGVRDEGAAADFVADVAAYVSVEADALVERRPHADGFVTIVNGGELGDRPLVMWLGGDLMILGAAEDDVDEALAARDGQSILDSAEYTAVMAELPNDRLMAMYLGVDWLADLYDDPSLDGLGVQADALRDAVDAVSGVGMAVTLRDEGVSFDVAYEVTDPDQLPLTSFDAAELEFLDRLPDDTLFHAAAPIEEGAVADALEPLRDIDPLTYDDIAAQARDFLGVDLFEDVLPAFGREAVLAVVPTPEGLLAQQSGVGIGGVLAIGVEDRGPVVTAVRSLEDYAVENGIGVVALGNVSVIEGDGQQFFAYALGDDALAIGTGPTIVDAAINGVSPSVKDNARYQELDRILPGDGVPVFVDIQGFFDAFDFQSEERALFDALQAAGAAGEMDGSVIRFSMLVTIDY